MPTTLSILVNAFGDPRERAKAIAVWTAASGIGIALGPIAGGALMRSFSWSSVFWINVPVLAVALVGALHVVPDSRDPRATKLDPFGAALSIAAIGTLVYAIIQAPDRGWTSTASLVSFAIGAVTAVVFIGWEMRRRDPMLDVRLFRNHGFSAGSIALALLFSRWQVLCSCRRSTCSSCSATRRWPPGSPLSRPQSGCCSVPGRGAHLAAHVGGRVAVAMGTLVAAAGVAVQAALIDGTSYVPTGVGLLLFGLGAGIAMPAATELIMATLPAAHAGVGSAVNDTVRELGGALGVAVIGSVAATSYASSMSTHLARFPGLTSTDRALLTDNVGAALTMSKQLGGNGAEIASVARTAFVDSMSGSLWVAVGLAVLSTVVAVVFLPRTGHAHGHQAHGHQAQGHQAHGHPAPAGAVHGAIHPAHSHA